MDGLINSLVSEFSFSLNQFAHKIVRYIKQLEDILYTRIFFKCPYFEYLYSHILQLASPYKCTVVSVHNKK